MRSDLNLADAILMGSSAVRAKAGQQHETQPNGEVAGCALGMANVAAGVTYSMSHRALAPGDNPRSRDTSMVWGEWVRKVVPRPCECTHKSAAEMQTEANSHGYGNDAWIHYHTLQMLAGPRHKWIFKLLPRELPIQDVITHLFDEHVMADPATWTLEQLADWVRTVEGPAREEEEKKRQAQVSVYGMFDSYWPVRYSTMSFMPSWMNSAAMYEMTQPLEPLNLDGLLIKSSLSREERQGYTWNAACAAWIKVTPASYIHVSEAGFWPESGAVASNAPADPSPITPDHLLEMANRFKEVTL
jgi:hypothetical protein